MNSEAVDAVVVGAGIIGLAIAYRLRGAGLTVGVVDPAPARAASHAAAGMLAPISEVKYGEAALLRLAMESLQRYPDFVSSIEERTGHAIGLRREGTLIVATDAGDREMLTELHAFQTSLGLSASMLTSRECRAVEPALTPEVRCGLLVGSDHSVDNRRLATALLTSAAADRVGLVSETVTSVLIDDGRAHGVMLGDGTAIAARWVVLAAGPWTQQISGLPSGVLPPGRPVKGEILRLQAHPPVLLPEHSIRGLVNGQEIYLIPRADGELVVGATVQEAGFDTTVRAGAVRELLRDARAVMPGIDELDLVESIAALRPGSPDNAPIIGATAVDGLVVATGHHRNGILLAPITADLVAGIVTDSVPDADRELLDAVSPQRFSPIGAPA